MGSGLTQELGVKFNSINKTEIRKQKEAGAGREEARVAERPLEMTARCWFLLLEELPGGGSVPLFATGATFTTVCLKICQFL